MEKKIFLMKKTITLAAFSLAIVFMASNAQALGTETKTAPSYTIPSNYLTPIKDQGDANLCWAYTATALTETALIREGLNNNTTPDLSEVHFGANQGFSSVNFATGSNAYSLMNYYFNLAGFVNENEYAKVNEISGGQNIKGAFAGTYNSDYRKSALKSRGIGDVRLLSGDINLVKRHISQNIPVGLSYSINVPAYEQIIDQRIHYDYKPQKRQGPNHIAVAVGYDDNKVINGQQGAFLIKNSWGRWRGTDGYMWISYRTFGYQTNEYLQFSLVDRITVRDMVVFGGQAHENYNLYKNNDFLKNFVDTSVGGILSGFRKQAIDGPVTHTETNTFTKKSSGKEIIEYVGNISMYDYNTVNDIEVSVTQGNDVQTSRIETKDQNMSGAGFFIAKLTKPIVIKEDTFTISVTFITNQQYAFLYRYDKSNAKDNGVIQYNLITRNFVLPNSENAEDNKTIADLDNNKQTESHEPTQARLPEEANFKSKAAESSLNGKKDSSELNNQTITNSTDEEKAVANTETTTSNNKTPISKTVDTSDSVNPTKTNHSASNNNALYIVSAAIFVTAAGSTFLLLKKKK